MVLTYEGVQNLEGEIVNRKHGPDSNRLLKSEAYKFRASNFEGVFRVFETGLGALIFFFRFLADIYEVFKANPNEVGPDVGIGFLSKLRPSLAVRVVLSHRYW